MRVKIYPEKNYFSLFVGNITARFHIDPHQPVLKLEYPEFYDIKITDKCDGHCPYCYMDSLPNKEHASNLLNKVKNFFSNLSDHDKPYQVAIGGGEPTLHPKFVPLLAQLRDMNIVPNYTTNGMHLTKHILRATRSLCGGVAISCHPHLNWRKAVPILRNYASSLNLHIVISDKKSVDYAYSIIQEFYDMIDYFVMLYYSPQGRGQEKKIEWDYMVETIPYDKKLAFGAGFTNLLNHTKNPYNIDAYGELFGAYIDFTEKIPTVYESSFNITERQHGGSYKIKSLNTLLEKTRNRVLSKKEGADLTNA